jgi:hypothetical protein
MLDKYVTKIKLAKTDKDIRYILECFYVESMISAEFREEIGNAIEKDEEA